MVLENNVILCFTKDAWTSTVRGRQQVMSRLARNNTVFYITWNFTVWRILSFIPLVFQTGRDSYRPAENLFVFSPHQILTTFMRLVWRRKTDEVAKRWRSTTGSIRQKMKSTVRFLVIETIKNKLRATGQAGKTTVLYIWDPVFSFVIGTFDEQLVCYHIRDELSLAIYKNSPAKSRWMAEAEKELLLKSDIVFAVTEELVDRKREHNTNIHFVPNGVNYTYFNQVGSRDTEITRDISVIPGPIIGYCGRIKSALDAQVLLDIALARESWSIVLVGPIGIKESNPVYYKKLKAVKNVYFLGNKAAKDIPRYIKAFDVCLLPYRLDTHMVFAYPLKLNEYLALGKSIVSADIATVRRALPHVKIASSLEEWIAAIEDYLAAPPGEETIKQRKEFARLHDWDTIVEKIERLIAMELEKSENNKNKVSGSAKAAPV